MPLEMQPSSLHRRENRETARFKIWLALGLAATSILTGALYFVYYLRVGNPITSLLPRDTVAYVRIGQASSLKEAFHNLELWTNTRPVRGQVNLQERRLLSRLLLDVGIDSALLGRLEGHIAEAHLAILAPEQQSIGENRYDSLVFLRVDDEPTYRELVSRISPYFDKAGTEAGVDISVRGAGPTAMAFATFDGWIVLCWGGDVALRGVLRNRERGPSNSLNDSNGFRLAYRASAHDSDVWAYIRHDHLADYLAHQWLGPSLSVGQRRALARYAKRAVDSELEGIGLSAHLQAGSDAGVLGLYGGNLGTVAAQTGLREKRTLDAVPSNAV
ncbi:MAG: hypothetical protein ACI9OJ_005146, partial [Myxococcota bacterium]